MVDGARIAAMAGRGEVKAACELLLAQHGREVERFIALSVAGRERREDVRQEVWAAVQKALPAFKNDALVRTWLLRIAKHKIIDEWRERPLEQTLGSEIADAGDIVARSSSRRQQTPSKLLHEKQRAVALRKALRELEPEERELLEMRFVLGLKPAEIAQVVGAVAPNTVSQRLVRVVRKLHALLHEESALDSFRQGRS